MIEAIEFSTCYAPLCRDRATHVVGISDPQIIREYCRVHAVDEYRIAALEVAEQIAAEGYEEYKP